GERCQVWEQLDGVRLISPRSGSPTSFRRVVESQSGRHVVVEHDRPLSQPLSIRPVANGFRVSSRDGSLPFIGFPKSLRAIVTPQVRQGKLRVFQDPRKRSSRYFERMLRFLSGRSVGVALSGGGAWGFAHIALLRRLREENIPVDYIAGHSIGALIGGVYCAGGEAALNTLIARRRELVPTLLASTVRSGSIVRFLDRLIGGVRLENLETSFLPMTADLRTGQSVILKTGPVTEAVSDAWRIPPFRASRMVGVKELVDGGLVNFLPVRPLREAGAAQIIASNAVPTRPGERGGRIRQAVQSACLVMRQLSAEQAKAADTIVELGQPDRSMFDYRHAEDIVARASRQLRNRTFQRFNAPPAARNRRVA
ncbi:MAG: patatin-like phospholipase family protein, partial [Myxococcota bacterium]